MNDQANALRGLMERRSLVIPTAMESAPQGAYAVTVTSGKGGVGKSNLALNLGMALARAEHSVLLIDANWGVGHIDMLCGMNGYWNLAHVLNGERHLEETLLEGPQGVRILPGAGSLADRSDHPAAIEEVREQMALLKRDYDFVIVDLGTGIHRVLRQFVESADRVLIVTTPEPPSLADAYATLKSLSHGGKTKWDVLVNQAESASLADRIFQRLKQTTRLFLQRELELAGWVPHDSHVTEAVARRTPFLSAHPHCPASQSIKLLARRLINQRGSGQRPPLRGRNASTAARASQAIHSDSDFIGIQVIDSPRELSSQPMPFPLT